MLKRRFSLLASLALIALAALCAPASAARDEDDGHDRSAWRDNRAEYMAKREAYFDEKKEYRNKYKKRIGSNKYLQKARKFYGRQENIYGPEYGDDPKGKRPATENK